MHAINAGRKSQIVNTINDGDVNLVYTINRDKYI